jgi:phenylpyruvate tautomerase PptA (4-oxalocrotonate tautomerase family)
VPIVRIDIQADKSTAYKREILHGVRDAITSALGVADDRVMQRLIETPVEDIDITEGRSDRLTIIEVSMLPGRDAELKSALYSAIVANLGEKPGIHQRDIMVLVNDPSAECFAIGGVMQCTLPSASETSADELLDEPEDVAAEDDDADETADAADVTDVIEDEVAIDDAEPTSTPLDDAVVPDDVQADS